VLFAPLANLLFALLLILLLADLVVAATAAATNCPKVFGLFACGMLFAVSW